MNSVSPTYLNRALSILNREQATDLYNRRDDKRYIFANIALKDGMEIGHLFDVIRAVELNAARFFCDLCNVQNEVYSHLDDHKQNRAIIIDAAERYPDCVKQFVNSYLSSDEFPLYDNIYKNI